MENVETTTIIAPDPIWTPMIPSIMPAEKKDFGKDVPLKTTGQLVKLSAAFVLLASRILVILHNQPFK